MAFKVAATPTRPGYPYEIERKILDPIGATIEVVYWENEDQYVAAVADADAIILGSGVLIGPRVLAQLKNVKLIINGAVGLDRVDVDAATAAGIPVVYAIDYHRGSHFSFSLARK